MKRKLSLVVAPAGYGKTTLLGEWLASTLKEGWPAAWLTLDGDDNNPLRFWGYVADALASVNPEWQLELPGMGDISGDGIDHQLLAAWINQIDADRTPFSLILDDYHTIQSDDIHKDLGYLITHMPLHMHLVIASRVKPKFPLVELRVKNQLAEIGVADLAFNAAESETFLQEVMGLKISAEELAALVRVTEGWAAGLQMAALSIKNQPDASQWIHRFSGRQSLIFDYLTEAILGVQDEPIQDFLLKTSILAELSAPLCDYLLGINDSRVKLHYLESTNLFITPLSEERSWYRYHALFADALKTRLEQTHPQLLSDLRLRACTWLKDNGFPEEAIPHAVSAGHPELAATIIEDCAIQALGQSDVVPIRRWISLLPDNLVSHRPLLWIYSAMVENALGNLDRAKTMLRKIRSALVDSKSGDDFEWDQASLQQQVSALQVIIDLQSENYTQVISLALQAMSNLPESDSLMYGWLNHFLGYAYESAGDLEAAIASFTRGEQFGLQHKIPSGILSRCEIGRIRKTQGRLREAERDYRRALDFAAEVGLARELVIFAQLGLGDVLIEQNDFKVMDQWAKEAELQLMKAEIDRNGWLFAIIIGLYTRLANYYLIRDSMKSKLFLQKARRELKKTKPFFFFSNITDLRVRIWLAEGDFTAAHGWVEKRMSSLESGKELSSAELIGLARIFLAEERPDAAHPRLEEVEARARQTGMGENLIETLILKARALKICGEEDKSIEILTQALAVAEPEGYVRIFVNEGRQVQLLISKILSHISRRSGKNSAPPTPAYLEKLLNAFDCTPRSWDLIETRKPLSPSTTSPLIEPLSKRELEVLALMKDGKSGSEIATLLVLSNNTVKVHIRNIYQKLGAHGRKEALERAAEYYLLEQPLGI